MTSAPPRISPGTRQEVGLVGWAIARASGLATGTAPPNLFLVLGRHRRLFRGWLRFAGRLMPGGRLPRRDTELVILRVAHLRGCEYEGEHHRHLARRAGLSADEIERVAHGPDADGWDARQRSLLTAVEELHHAGDLTDATWTELRRHLDEVQAIELVMLAGHYEMLATFINTMRVPPDGRRRRRG
jgi:AhpD family alkylhydroperoxidase